MAETHDTQLRQWAMLQAIPRHPRKITSRELAELLETAGFTVSKRTVERDLVSLSGIFPLVSDEREKPYGWSWQQEALSFNLPAMSPVQALTLALAHEYLNTLLPACLTTSLDPYFKAAEKLLTSEGEVKRMAEWRDHVAIVPPTQALLPPTYSEEVVETVHKALLEGRQLEIRYRSCSAGETQVYRAYPLGIVQRGPVTYLVATLFKYDDPRSLALHRIEAATMLDARAKRPKGFDLKQHVASGAFGFEIKGPIKLVVRFREETAQHLLETPLSTDQRVTPDGEGWMKVQATVIETSQLYWWLLGFGDGVVVLEPRHVRGEISKTVGTMANLYKTIGQNHISDGRHRARTNQETYRSS